MLSVKNLSKRFNTAQAVKDVSFQILPGEVYGLLGPNGAGKTTIIRMIAGTMKPTKGKVWINSHNLDSHRREARLRLGILFSGAGLHDKLTALENVTMWGILYGLSKKESEKRADELLSYLGMRDFRDRQVAKFSQGMQQRIHLARALVHDPDVLLFDEPTNGLDVPSTVGFEEIILKLKAEGRTILLCTHIMPQVEKLCDRVGILHSGELILEDTVTAIRSRFARSGRSSMEEAILMLMRERDNV